VFDRQEGGKDEGERSLLVLTRDSLRERAIKFAKDNAEAAFAQAEKLAQAKDVQDLMTLQSHYAQAQMRSYATQAQELGRLMTTAMQNMQSPKP
jgi:hypothetical protein